MAVMTVLLANFVKSSSALLLKVQMGPRWIGLIDAIKHCMINYNWLKMRGCCRKLTWTNRYRCASANLQNICTLTLQTVQGVEVNPGTTVVKPPTATTPPASSNPPPDTSNNNNTISGGTDQFYCSCFISLCY